MTGLMMTAALAALAVDVLAADPLAGDWAGWLYGDGFDAPLRLHVASEGETMTGSVTLPHLGTDPLPLASVSRYGTDVRLERINSEGRPQTWTASIEGDLLRGDLLSDGTRIAGFELHRSPVALPVVDPEAYAAATGAYRFASGRSIVLSPWFWGEMRYLDTSSGRYGTLFATSTDTFFAGSAMYVPGPVTARVELQRDADDEVTALVWWDENGKAEVARRAELVEEEVEFQNGDTRLAGTLILPGTPGPHPAVVVLGGSGWSTRTRVRFDADILASMGMAVLIYDKRGYGESGGKRTVPFKTTAADAVAAVRHLRSRPEIRADRVGLTGRSRGGWFAPLAAAQSSDVAFLVLFVAPAVSPAEQETTRRLNLLRSAGVDAKGIAEASAYLDLQWAFARTGEGWEAYADTRRRMEEQGWLDELGGPDTSDPEPWEWSHLNMFHDPIPSLEKIDAPVLAIFGGADRNVVPEINQPLMELAFDKAGNTDATTVVIPGANHGLRRAGDAGKPLHRQQGYAPEVWSTVAEWLRRQM